MKKLLLILTLLPFTSKATGVLSVNFGMLNSSVGTNRPMVGLYIEEPIRNGVTYQSWTGVKVDKWFLTDQGIMVPVNQRIKFGVGPSFEYGDGVSNTSFKIYTEMKLW
jgi:hypothetical protein